jgi:hypothetical protein
MGVPTAWEFIRKTPNSLREMTLARDGDACHAGGRGFAVACWGVLDRHASARCRRSLSEGGFATNADPSAFLLVNIGKRPHAYEIIALGVGGAFVAATRLIVVPRRKRRMSA